ncbi:hypothetical protein [Brevibacterium litoralis]|uniref:hypothetical protein n=1 Tax=Brevibacterium litoralis TaxID=3138935 RepID=UPI0032EE0972
MTETTHPAPVGDNTAAEPMYPDAIMRYGTTDRQVADVFEPPDPVDSLFLLLHGGLWREADRMRTWAVGRAGLPAGTRWATGNPQVTGVVALAPAADLATMRAEGLDDGAIDDFFGGGEAPGEDVLAVADPVRLRPTVPVRVLHGSADTVIPPAISENYENAHAGAPVTRSVVEGVDHTAWGAPTSEAWGTWSTPSP